MSKIRFGCCLPSYPLGFGETRAEMIVKSYKKRMAEGYDYAEWVASTIAELPEEEFLYLENLHREGKFGIESSNGFIPGTVPVVGEHVDWDQVDAYLSKCVRRIAALGAKVVVFGSGAARKIPDGYPLEKAEEDMIHALHIAAKYAELYNIDIVIEPLHAGECNFINSVEDGYKIAKRANHPRVKVLADLFHMEKDGETALGLKPFADILAHCHVAEVPTREYPGENGGEAVIDFVKGLREIGYEGRMSVECTLKDIDHDAKAAIDFLKSI